MTVSSYIYGVYILLVSKYTRVSSYQDCHFNVEFRIWRSQESCYSCVPQLPRTSAFYLGDPSGCESKARLPIIDQRPQESKPPTGASSSSAGALRVDGDLGEEKKGWGWPTTITTLQDSVCSMWWSLSSRIQSSGERNFGERIKIPRMGPQCAGCAERALLHFKFGF